MNVYVRGLAAAGLLVLSAGCASTHVLVGEARPPITPDQVKIYIHPPAKFDEIALIDASSKSSFAVSDQGKMDKVMQRLKVEAAKLGANGVLLQSTGERSGGSVNTGFANATAYGNSAYGYGTGVSVPVEHKAGTGVAIYVYGQDDQPRAAVVQTSLEPVKADTSALDAQLRKLKKLKDDGILTEDEYLQEKKKVLNRQSSDWVN